MPTSEARILANRQNALKSTGPKTEDGKAQSRRNGWKHGLTGAGIVLAEVDATEVERRNLALQKEIAPSSMLGTILVRQMATLSVRMERAGRAEVARMAERVRHAEEDFDHQRLDEADRWIDMIGQEPRIMLRKLKKSPEGVERLIEAWRELRAALTHEPRPIWTAWHRERAENLTGHRIEEATGSKIGDLSKAIWGDFSGFDEPGRGDKETRKGRARARMIERIDAEIAELEEHGKTLDLEILEIDRAEAPQRALFDPSPEAILARRYEAAASRDFYKALKLLLEVESESPEPPTVTPVEEPPHEPLASSCAPTAPAAREPRKSPGLPRTNEVSRCTETEEALENDPITPLTRT